MRVQHNISAINANRNLTGNNSAVSKSLEKLSSGYRINRAGDDAAGLAISEKMRAQISCLTQAETNCNDGVSLIQTAEGALTEVHSMLNRMVELAEQSANGTYTDETDRENLQSELEQLKSEINRISDATNFNGINLLDGTLCNKVSATAITDKGGKVTISGGTNLTTADKIGIAVASDGTVTLSETSFTVGATALEATDFKAAVTSFTRAAGTATTDKHGVYTFTLNMDATKATAQEYEKFNGMTITVDTSSYTNTQDLSAASYTISKTGELSLQIGDTADDYNKLNVSVQDMDCVGLGIDAISVGTQPKASAAIETIKSTINKVSATRGDLGAMQNRLEHTINNLSVTNENITNAESRIRDTDMAKEMMTYTSKNILAQAAQSMLAQANQQPQQVLSLLQ